MPLTGTEKRIVTSIGSAFFPRGGAIAADAIDIGIVDYLDDYIDRLPRLDGLSIRALIRGFDEGFRLFPPQVGRRFVDAHPDEQREYLDSWEHSPLYARRMAWQALRTVFAFAYFEAPEVKAAYHMGLPPGLEPKSEPTETPSPEELS